MTRKPTPGFDGLPCVPAADQNDRESIAYHIDRTMQDRMQHGGNANSADHLTMVPSVGPTGPSPHRNK